MRTQTFGIMIDASKILCSRKEEERTECEELASLPSPAQPTPPRLLENLRNSVSPHVEPWEMKGQKQGPSK